MPSLKYMLVAATVALAAPQLGPYQRDGNVPEFMKRDDPGPFTTQRWGNEDSDFDWDSRSGGEYAVTWDQPASGNFVVGKGYHGQEMSVS